MIERLFENIKYGSYYRNDDFNDSPIEYEQRLFTKKPIDSFTNNSVEIFKVGSIKRLLDNRIYESNHWNSDFDYLPFDGDERLLARITLYHIHDDIVFRSVNCSNVYL